MPPWWERFDGVLQRELDALAARGLQFVVDEEEKARGRIVLRGAAPAGRLGNIELAIVYPDTFPHHRPTVFQASRDRLSRHQNPFDGNYCLIGRSPDQWRPGMTAAELLDGLPDLVNLVNQGGSGLSEAEEPQGEPITAYYGTLNNGCILVPGWIDDIDKGVTGGRLRVRFNTDRPFPQDPAQGQPPGLAGQGLLVELTDENGNALGPVDARLQNRFTGPTWTGRWVRVDPDDPPSPDPRGFLEHLVRLDDRIKSSGSTPGNNSWKFSIDAALFPEEVSHGRHGQSLLFLARGTKTSKKHGNRKSVGSAAPIRAERYDPSTLTERITPLRSLRDATVALIGLGTLGAPLACSLAQAQTGRLRIADGDVVDPGTTVRWPAGLPAAGIEKGAWLAKELMQHYPFVEVTSEPVQIGSTPPPGARLPERSDQEILQELMHGADLVIEATAADDVSRAVTDVATELGVPQLYLWGIDGHGGVVARVLPGQTGCFHCLSVALHDGRIPPPPAALYPSKTQVQPTSCADTTFVAPASELQPLAVQATRLAFATLTGTDTEGYGEIDDDVFVLELREPDGRPVPAPRWHAHQLPAIHGCWYCTP